MDGLLIGYYSYFILSDTRVKLENLFIDPQFINCGFGKLLLINFIERVREFGFKKVVLESDPNAERFYIKSGFQKVGQKESSIKKIFLPIMEKEIMPAHNNSETNSLMSSIHPKINYFLMRLVKFLRTSII